MTAKIGADDFPYLTPNNSALLKNSFFSGKHKQQKLFTFSFGSAKPFNVCLFCSMLPDVEVDVSVCGRWLGIFSFLLIIDDSRASLRSCCFCVLFCC